LIVDLKPYPKYKESGVSSLGQVPQHWEVRKPRHVGSLLKGVGGTKEDALPTGVPCVRYGELYTTHTFFVRRPKTFIHPDRAAGYTPLHYGDVLFAASGETLEEIGKSAVNLIDGTAVCGGDVIILRPTVPVHAPFLGYAMDCRPMANQKATMGRGTTVKHIYPDELKQLLFPLPPVPEQTDIVRFLDWANGRLDRAIRAKRKVIAVLNEQKQAIIHQAVSRGLNPRVPVKPSGIPWLGDIPGHWEVRRIKYLLRETNERSSTGAEPLLSMRMHHGLVLFADHFARPPQAATLVGFKLVRPGQFVVNRMQAGNGVIFASALAGLVSPDYAVFDPIGDANVTFLGELFRSRKVRAKFRAESKGLGTGTSGFLRLYNDRLGAIHVALPPHDEQGAIVAGLAGEVSGVNTTISRLEREIELLREYRNRLVSDVVTGKLDVREASARLPEEGAPETVEDGTDPSIDPEVADVEAA
jgi:type I restriction enzyme S subunit